MDDTSNTGCVKVKSDCKYVQNGLLRLRFCGIIYLKWLIRMSIMGQSYSFMAIPKEERSDELSEPWKESARMPKA